MKGVVEKIAFTQGGAGNQWTTISGVCYATFWDIRTKDWEVGDTVEFERRDTSLWHGQPLIPHATSIRRAAPETVEGN